MVAELANTRIKVFRGTGENQFGDTIDADVPVIEGLPVFLAETGKNTQDPSSATPRTIRQIVCVVPQWVGALNTDRIYDESTGETYMVISVTRQSSLTGAPVDVLLDLKRVSAQTA